MKLFISLILLVLFALPAWGAEYWVTQTGAGAQNGTSLANAWAQGSIVYGGTNAFGRGDILYACGTPEAPITVTIAPSGVGAFDGTANATADILEISGQADKCGGVEGKILPASGHGINGSGIAALYVHDIACLGTTGTSANCFNQLLSSTSGCTASAGYFCGLQYNLTCTGAGSHCASIASSGNTNFPASAVTGVWQHDISSTGAGGAACRVALNTNGAIQERCYSDGDAQTDNTWSVYQRGITLNCGAANNGAGVTWTQVSGNVYKTSQSNCGSSINTVIDVYAANPATGVPGRLALDAACVDDASCGSNVGSGEYGVVTGTVYINKGNAVGNQAAVYLTYAWNLNARMRDSTAHNPGAAYDGVGLGCDFGTDGCIIERVYSRNAPGYAATCGGGSKNCTLRSSISQDAQGPGGFRLNSGATGENLSVGGNAVGVYAFSLNGETITARNVAISGGTAAIDGRGDGTLTEVTNSNAADFLGGTNPTSPVGFRLKPTSPLVGAGIVGAKYDYDNKRCGNPSNIGAFCTTYQDTRSSYTTRTDY